MTSALDVDTVREAARGRWPSILATLGVEVSTNPKKKGPCPACGCGKDRFRFDDQEGRGTWFCNQCDPKAGDGFDLVQNVRRCDFLAAFRLVQDCLGGVAVSPLRSSLNGHGKRNGRERPATVAMPPGELGRTLFLYHHADGRPSFYVQRLEKENGKKEFPQYGPTADGKAWQSNMEYAPKPKPLYRLPEILAVPDAVVLIHEGEKADEAHLAAGLPGIPTTASGGAGNAHFTDFSPLAGRHLVICPDHDEPGEKHAAAVAQLAHAAGAASVKVLRLPDLPHKGDVVEWLASGGTPEAFAALIETAEEIVPLQDAPPKELLSALVSYKDLLKMTLPERARHLPWLMEGGNVMVFGPRGVGKTFLQLALAVSLTTGKDLLRWKVSRPVGVLYIDGEMQLDELRKRATALIVTPPLAPLEFLTSEVVYHRLGCDLVLSSEPMRQEVVKILDAHPDIRVIILDNISSLFGGIDEDSKRDWEPIGSWLVRLRHRGLTTVLVHHAGKGGQQRGTSGREDSLDTVIQLDRPADHDAREGCHFELTFTKNRSVKGDDVAPIDVRLEEHGGQLHWSWKTLEASKRDRARVLMAEGVTSPTELSEELKINKGYASRLMKQIRAEASV